MAIEKELVFLKIISLHVLTFISQCLPQILFLQIREKRISTFDFTGVFLQLHSINNCSISDTHRFKYNKIVARNLYGDKACFFYEIIQVFVLFGTYTQDNIYSHFNIFRCRLIASVNKFKIAIASLLKEIRKCIRMEVT